MRPQPTAEALATLQYDPETGAFTWRDLPGREKWAGKPAGSIGLRGYLRIPLKGASHSAHRLAWLIVTGHWPTDQIDHINGDRADNRFANLREATNSQNNANKAPRAGRVLPKGVHWHKQFRKYQALIQHDGKVRYLGRFDDPAVAGEAYRKAAEEIFGEFARTAA